MQINQPAVSGTASIAPPVVGAPVGSRQAVPLKVSPVAPQATPVAGASRAASQAEAQPADLEALARAVQEANQEPSVLATNLSFSIDQDLKRVVVKLVDTNTQDVIRQIPSEEFLRISKALQQMQGLFVREQA